jgi:hypothetical protein
MNKVSQLYNHVKTSAFNKSAAYSVNVNFKTLFQVDSGMVMYNDAINEDPKSLQMASNEIIQRMTPVFQRSNTKWSQKMQIRFVENVLCGCDTKIQLFHILDSGSEIGNCFILDGLQRTTAISAFHMGEFPIFGDIYWKDIKDDLRSRLRLQICIYTFDDEIDAVQFYIDMNEGITHSESDLIVAYEHLARLKAA